MSVSVRLGLQLDESCMRMERRGLLGSSGNEEDDEQNDTADEGVDYEEAISATGYGKFHYWLTAVGGFANASDAIEILCVSILLPAAQCDLHMSSTDKGLLVALVFVGMMIGGYVWGCLGDIYGRRNTLIFSLLVNALGGIISSFAQEFPLFVTMRFISGLGVGGSIPLVWAYISEFQPAHKRGSVLSIIASFWMVGNILVAALGLAVIPLNIGIESPSFTYNSWRIFLLLCAVPSLIIAVLLLWLPESPMFILSKGRHEETIEILQRVYSKNTGKPMKNYPITSVNTFGIKIHAVSNVSLWKYVKESFYLTWHQTISMFDKPLIRATVLMLLINFTIQFGYYGLWLWFPELFNRLETYYNEHPNDKVSVCELTKYHGNTTDIDCNSDNLVDPQALVNTLITASAAFPANIWTIASMDKLGRKFFLVFSMVLSGGAAFGIYFVKTATDNLILGCVFGAVSTMGFNALDCLGAELFPTHLRSTALAVTLLSARFGAITGNLIFGALIDLHCAVPIFLVATLLIGGGLLSLLLPNTTRVALR